MVIKTIALFFSIEWGLQRCVIGESRRESESIEDGVMV